MIGGCHPDHDIYSQTSVMQLFLSLLPKYKNFCQKKLQTKDESCTVSHKVPAGAIEKIFEADGNPWFKCTHMGKFLDVKFINASMKNLDSKGTCIQDCLGTIPSTTGR